MEKQGKGCGLMMLGTMMLMALLLGGVVGAFALFVNPRTGADTAVELSALLQAPPEPLSEPATLKLVTFNVQNLYFVGRNRPARMRAIGAKLAELDPDIACFQECFVPADRQILIDALGATRLRHFEYFQSGTVGSGLLIASAYPIVETYFHRYAATNEWYRLWEGDWWAGKGIALARVQLPQGMIDVFNTHAQATYGREANRRVRLQQMRDAAAFIRDARSGTSPAFALGDWNCRAGDPDHDLLVAEAGLTCLMDDVRRIDLIFGVDDARYAYELTDFVVMDRHDGLRMSDHKGYMSTIRITPAAQPV
jgi:sphingomyelin phosphodiesterase 2